MKHILLNAIAFCVAIVVAGCTSDSDLNSSYVPSTTGEVDDATEWIDGVLSEQYLYNEEYNTLNRDLTLSYDTFLNQTLLSMNTNILDKKYYADYGEYSIFSSVYREAVSNSASTRAASYMESYGLLSLSYEYISERNCVIAVLAVNNDSPASRMGLTRGMVIEQINGVNVESLSDPTNTLYYPTSSSTITMAYREGPSESYPIKICTLTSSLVDQNPVLLVNKFVDDGANTVGYLNYTSFDDDYETELSAALEQIRGFGVTDLILDLRLNLGGTVSTANLLCATIASESATNGAKFCQFRYNESFSASNTTKPWSMGATYYDSSIGRYVLSCSSVSSARRLNMNRIFCLVDYDTASASELLIVSLRDLGVEVNLIGDTTRGKNAAMLGSQQTIDGYTYYLYPITSESYGGGGTGGFEAGIKPDCYVDQLSGLQDFGVNEPLIATALTWISTGTKPISDVDSSASSFITRASNDTSLRSLTRPAMQGVIVHPLEE